MKARRATLCDLPRILQIYGIARELMKASGNPGQWGAVYPPEELVKNDLEKGYLHVLERVAEDGKILLCGAFAFLPEGDDVYNNIEGKWLNDLPHAAIHRVASSGEVKGVMPACAEFCLTKASNLKIDTHADNKIMQRQLEKLGFTPCGIITLADGSKRIAYQLYKES